MTAFSYIWEALFHGYDNNKYEVPAYQMTDKITDQLSKNGGSLGGCN
jgi:hypothetical protein